MTSRQLANRYVERGGAKKGGPSPSPSPPHLTGYKAGMPIDIHLLQEVFSQHRRLGARTAPGFILGWAAFNHIYGAHWDDAPLPRRGGDRQQMLHFADSTIAATCFSASATSRRSSSGLPLPLTNRYGGQVPVDLLRAGRYKPGDLSVQQYLAVIYEIRNSFVHGSQRFRDLDGEMRSAFAESFGEFLNLLVKRVAPGVHA